MVEHLPQGFRAIDADGRSLGDFPKDREATHAITSRAGELRASRGAA
jgi:hypothetical protein